MIIRHSCYLLDGHCYAERQQQYHLSSVDYCSATLNIIIISLDVKAQIACRQRMENNIILQVMVSDYTNIMR